MVSRARSPRPRARRYPRAEGATPAKTCALTHERTHAVALRVRGKGGGAACWRVCEVCRVCGGFLFPSRGCVPTDSVSLVSASWGSSRTYTACSVLHADGANLTHLAHALCCSFLNLFVVLRFVPRAHVRPSLSRLMRWTRRAAVVGATNPIGKQASKPTDLRYSKGFCLAHAPSDAASSSISTLRAGSVSIVCGRGGTPFPFSL